MSNVLIISTSLRGGSNSELLAQECRRGAEEAGHKVTFLCLKGKKIQYCIGCLSCQKTEKCVLQDDAPEFVEQVKKADILVFATPIYYYEMSGQMKTLLDRLNPLYSSDYKFRKVYMIATAADGSDEAFEKAYQGLQGWVDCFPRCALAGTVFAGGVNGVGEIAGHAVLEQAYQMGKEV